MTSHTEASQEFDLLVVGSGTGMMAALAASSLGLRPLIVEKTEYVGGSMALSGGAFWIPGNSVIRDDGGLDPRDRAAEYLAALVGDSTDPARWQSYLEHGPAAVDFLREITRVDFMWSQGYSDYHSEQPGGSASGRTCESKPFNAAILGAHRDDVRSSRMAAPLPMPITGVDYRLINLMATLPTKGVPRAMKRLAQGLGGKAIGREYVSGGAALATGLYEAVLRKGVPVWRNAELTELVTDGDRVTGAVIERDGRPVTVTARKGVVLAAGGFDHNLSMRHEHQLESLDDWSLGSPGNTGDAIHAGTKVGAGTALLDQSWWFPAVAPLPGEAPKVMLAERALPGSFMVDGTGCRFIDEATDYMSFGQRILQRDRSGDPVGQVWIIFDQKYRNSYVFAGELFPRMSIPDEWYAAGIAHRADTMADLAAKTGLEKLPETARRFEVLASAGNDDDFDRGKSSYDRYYGDPSHGPNPSLRPLEQAPFYAVKVVLSDLGTCGGMMADSLGRVQRQDGSIIDGLYATGNNAANAFGDRYPGAGATIGQGLVFGYVAAHHAAGRL